LVIQPDGQCQVWVEGADERRDCGKIVLFEFRDAAALRFLPGGLYASTEDSGRAFASRQAGADLILRQGWLEESNATPDKEAGHDRMVLQLSPGSSR
jgi:flagellar basal body rod protein FlgG